MRYIIILLLLTSCIKPIDITGATYYVAIGGSDSNPGTTIGSPFKTLTAAFNVCNAGDYIYIRGGTYSYSDIGLTTLSSRNGTSGNPIRIFNYPNEHPVFDYQNYYPESTTRALRIDNCDYIHIKGLEIKNLRQGSTGTNNGIYIGASSSNNIIENCNIHHIGGWGVVILGGSDTEGEESNNNHILNVDSHHHADRLTGWGGADGFLMNSYRTSTTSWPYASTGTVYENCRAWRNSDDGWDHRLFNGDVTLINCQAFENGWRPGATDEDADDMSTTGGNGYGFKLGSVYNAHTAVVLRTMHGCLAFNNRETGIQCESSAGGTPTQYDLGSRIYNNTAYGNGRAGFSHGAIHVGTTWLRNNLSYANSYDIASDDPSIDDDYNASDSHYWRRRDFIPTAYDFISLDPTGVDGTRKEDGSLPVLNFLRLRETSPLVDVGVYVGLSYNGEAPDLGAFETGVPVSVTTPGVATIVVTEIGTTTATTGGYVYDDGGASVTARGVCWSTMPNPTPRNNHTSDGTGTGSFVSSITGLEPGTSYYVRAYATNSVGTAYGNSYSFVASDGASSVRVRIVVRGVDLVVRDSNLVIIP
jgi:hypothetical protein